MQHATIGAAELHYEVRGTGAPILLIHGAHIVDAMRPLAVDPALEPFGRITYHRRGHGGSATGPAPTSVADHADDAAGLLDFLGIASADIVGHSSGGVVALELAARHPASVRSLTLLEPALLDVPAATAFMDAVGRIVERYAGGDPAGAVDDFLAGVGDERWRETIERVLPGAVERAEREAASFFEIELPVVASWSFGPDRAAAVSAPVLSVVGSASGPMWTEGRERLHAWFPACRDVDIPGVTHLLQMENPAAVAAEIAAFCADAVSV